MSALEPRTRGLQLLNAPFEACDTSYGVPCPTYHQYHNTCDKD